MTTTTTGKACSQKKLGEKVLKTQHVDIPAPPTRAEPCCTAQVEEGVAYRGVTNEGEKELWGVRITQKENRNEKKRRKDAGDKQ